jgi:hypothetical protein
MANADAVRFTRVADSPPFPDQPGLVLRIGAASLTHQGTHSRWIHGAWLLAQYEADRTIVVVAQLHGTSRVFMANLYGGDTPTPPDPAPPTPEGELAGGVFNLDFREDFAEVGTGARPPLEACSFHVAAHWRDLRSPVLTLELPAA